MALRRLRHLLVETLIATPLHHFWWWVLVAIVTGIGTLWAAVQQDREMLVGFAIGFGICLLLLSGSALLEFRRAWKTRLRRQWKLRHYTSDGLSWWEVERKRDQERVEITVRVRPTGAVKELPQPLRLLVICNGPLERHPDIRHQPSDTDDAELYPADGETMALLKLRSPRLHPPDHLDIHLKSAGPDLGVIAVKWSR